MTSAVLGVLQVNCQWNLDDTKLSCADDTHQYLWLAVVGLLLAIGILVVAIRTLTERVEKLEHRHD
jgi:hypothetical protein